MNYWKISPGEYGYLKDDFIQNKIIALGANDVGDLTNLTDEQIIEKTKEEYGERARFYTQLLEFKNEFKIGDKVLLYGKSSILALGEITSDYKYDEEQNYFHTRKVEWNTTYDFYYYPISELDVDLQKTLQKNRTIVKLTEEEWNEIIKESPPDKVEQLEDIIQDDYTYNITKEKDLQDYLWNNLSSLENGLIPLNLELFAEDAGRIDILACDIDNNLVVIEIKAVLADDNAVSQTLRYMGWVQENKEDFKAVRGILVSYDFTTRARYAAKVVDNIKLVNYKVSFNFEEQ